MNASYAEGFHPNKLNLVTYCLAAFANDTTKLYADKILNQLSAHTN